MSTYKPAGSRFYHFDFQFKGRRFHGSSGCTAKRDADRYEAEVRRKAALGQVEKEPITLNEAAGRWWKAKGSKLANASTEQGQMLRLIDRLGATKLIGDLKLSDLDGYVAWRRASVSNASVNREIELLRRVINWTGKRSYDVPELDWSEALLKEPPGRTRILTPDEERRLVSALPDDLKTLIAYALLSGQRRSEVVKLRWSDVDFQHMRVTRIIKGGETHSYPLTEQMVALIANQPKAAAQVFTYTCERSAPRRKDRPARVKGQRYPFSVKGWNRKWKKAVAAAKLEDFRFHDLRHTALTRLGSIEAANKLAGHTSMKTTQRYFHTQENEVREAMRASQSRNSPEVVKGECPQTRRKAANDG